ncbi:MAG: hypothetical protein GC151_14065 [Betaproteobacteria bacterium]|nr:hypothetical protein [Betaproteobacteria bacterium]
MKIEFRLLQELHGYSLPHRPSTRLSQFARPITNARDYREAKAALSRLMRNPDERDGAVRAEALLREIVDYEMRLDIGEEESYAAFEAAEDYDGPRRRWSDPDDEDGPH